MSYKVVDTGVEGMSVAFTGHRVYPNQAWTYRQILETTEHLFRQGFTTFISGGAAGVDQAAARAVLEIKQTSPVKLIVAKPFEGQESKWPAEHQKAYQELLQQADRVVLVSLGGYAVYKFHVRDRWMVDHSDLVVGVWDGRKAGGTYGTLQYAKKKHLPIRIINPEEMTVSGFEPL